MVLNSCLYGLKSFANFRRILIPLVPLPDEVTLCMYIKEKSTLAVHTDFLVALHVMTL